jgi:carbamoyl-phosphate synthase small subunit
MEKLKLILKDGTEFSGESFGYWPKIGHAKWDKTGNLRKAEFAVDGEVVFNTGMVGYPESLTDPSYRGQILVLTYPMIGNYGVPETDKMWPHSNRELNMILESNAIHVRGLIVNEYCDEPHHWESKRTLSKWLIENKIPAIQGVDTRALTQKLREHGVMLGKITSQEAKYAKDLKFENPNLTNLVAEVTCKKMMILEPPDECAPLKKHLRTVVVYDTGVKHNILRSFLNRGVRIIRVPWDFDLTKLKVKFDGLFVANGPGDPKMAHKTIEALRVGMGLGVPIFGICLGSQLLALAAGGNTYKLKYGHRSANQPCIDLGTKRCYITSQNHGYAVDEKKLPRGWRVWFRNANDGTVEGIRHATKPWISVQFHPEASPGPEDAEYLFDEFVDMIRK